jgi:hypothetical protein
MFNSKGSNCASVSASNKVEGKPGSFLSPLSNPTILGHLSLQIWGKENIFRKHQIS